jgi:hypothetical protein
MRKFLTIAICVGMMATMLVGVAGAGLNAGALAHLYFMPSTGSTVPVPARTSTAATAICLVTVTGVSSARGADVQLIVSGLDTHGLPMCWQVGSYTGVKEGWRGKTVTVFAPLLGETVDGGAVTGVITINDASFIDYHDGTNPTFTPNNCGLIQYSASGSVGKTRLTTKEYSVVGFTMTPDDGTNDPASIPCIPVCIGPNWRLGTGGHDGFWVMQVADANNVTDFVPFAAGNVNLVYGTTQYPGGCPEVITPATAKTWGMVKKLYR